MVLKVYIYKESPPSRAVLITAKALEIDINVEILDVYERKLYSPEFLKINPQHTVPILDDDGSIIWDSHAINSYLVKKYGKTNSLYPNDPYKCALIDQRLHFDTGVLFEQFRSIMVDLIKKRVSSLSEYRVQDIKDSYGILEKFLEGHKWIASEEVSLADISAATSTTALNIMVPIDATNFPNITAWINNCKKLPAFQGDEVYLGYLKKSYDHLLHRASTHSQQ